MSPPFNSSWDTYDKIAFGVAVVCGFAIAIVVGLIAIASRQ